MYSTANERIHKATTVLRKSFYLWYYTLVHYLRKKETVLVMVLLIFYLFTRLFHLTILPIFTDEAEYIYWAKLIATTNKQWFISLIGTQPPLFIWSMVPFLKILPSYLVAGRMASVMA